MNPDPRSPFNWKLYPRPSIFATDPSFRAGKDGKSVSEAQSAHLNKRREEGENVGYLHGIGKKNDSKVEQMLAYRPFGVFSRAKSKGKK